MPIAIPAAPVPAITTGPRHLVLYGATKIGKTTALSKLDDAVIADLEPSGGASHLTCRRVTIKSYTEFMDLCRVATKDNSFKYFCVDSLDALEDMCRVEAVARYKSTNIGANFNGRDVCTELPQGAGYQWLRACLVEAMHAAMSTGKVVIFIGHVLDKIDTNSEGKEVKTTDLDLTGKCKKLACQMVDVVGHMTRRNRPKKHPAEQNIADLWLSFKTSEDIVCGNRVSYLKNRELLFSSADSPEHFNWAEIFNPPTVETTTTQ